MLTAGVLHHLVQKNSIAYSCAVVSHPVTKGIEGLSDADLFKGGIKLRKQNVFKRKTEILIKLNAPALPVTSPTEPHSQIPDNFRDSGE